MIEANHPRDLDTAKEKSDSVLEIKRDELLNFLKENDESGFYPHKVVIEDSDGATYVFRWSKSENCLVVSDREAEFESQAEFFFALLGSPMRLELKSPGREMQTAEIVSIKKIDSRDAYFDSIRDGVSLN